MLFAWYKSQFTFNLKPERAILLAEKRIYCRWMKIVHINENIPFWWENQMAFCCVIKLKENWKGEEERPADDKNTETQFRFIP